MYYYAYINESNICEGVYALPSALNLPSYISITQEEYNSQSVVGKYYNANTQQFEDPSNYYAVLNDDNICIDVIMETTTLAETYLIPITSLDTSLVGQYYDSALLSFVDAPVSVQAELSTNDINYKLTNQWLSDKLDAMDTAIANSGSSSSGGSGGGSMSGFDILNALSGIDGSGSGLDADLLDGKHVAELALATHTHDNYALSTHTHTEATTTQAGFMSAADKTKLDNMSSGGGENGKSAYQIAVDNGFEGTETAWLDSLHGEDGQDGQDGQDGTTVIIGTTTTGEAGTSATVTGVTSGNTLTLNFTIPRGADGQDGQDGQSGAEITAAQVLNKLKTVDGQNSGLDADMLDGHDSTYFATATQLTGKADSNHTHTEYATSDHTHNGYAISTHTHSEYAAASHTHNDYATTTALSNKADLDHTHTLSSLGAAASNHTHSGYASSNHTHNNYASSSHTHSDYLSTSGGTVSGELNVTSAIRANGQQAIYNSGSQIILGTNNLATTIACGSSSDVTVNGAKMYIPSLLPRSGGSFQIGNSSYRFSGIYLTSNPNVSSDERLKEDIKAVDILEMADFIEHINIVNFRYKDDADKTERLGVVAQQLISAQPEIAKYIVEEDEKGYFGVKTSDLVFPLICAVQELSKRVKELETK